MSNESPNPTVLKVLSPAKKTSSFKSQSHGMWFCNYQVIIVPRYRKHILFSSLAKEIGTAIGEFASRKDSNVLQCTVCSDHIHLAISIPPKYSPTNVIQFLKSASSVQIQNRYTESRQKSIVNDSFWSRGYCISTAIVDDATIEKFIDEQWEIDQFFDGPEFDLDWS